MEMRDPYEDSLRCKSCESEAHKLIVWVFPKFLFVWTVAFHACSRCGQSLSLHSYRSSIFSSTRIGCGCEFLRSSPIKSYKLSVFTVAQTRDSQHHELGKRQHDRTKGTAYCMKPMTL